MHPTPGRSGMLAMCRKHPSIIIHSPFRGYTPVTLGGIPGRLHPSPCQATAEGLLDCHSLSENFKGQDLYAHAWMT